MTLNDTRLRITVGVVVGALVGALSASLLDVYFRASGTVDSSFGQPWSIADHFATLLWRRGLLLAAFAFFALSRLQRIPAAVVVLIALGAAVLFEAIATLWGADTPWWKHVYYLWSYRGAERTALYLPPTDLAVANIAATLVPTMFGLLTVALVLCPLRIVHPPDESES